MEAITQDEFDKLKSKFLNQVNSSTSSSATVESSNNTILPESKPPAPKKFVICPTCGEKTPLDENRCQSCNIMLNKFMLKNAKIVDEHGNELSD